MAVIFLYPLCCRVFNSDHCADAGFVWLRNQSMTIKLAADIKESTLYPILKKLEKSGYLTTYSQLHQGRKRKYYSITALGKQQIQQLHEEWVSYRDTIEGIIEGRLRK